MVCQNKLAKKELKKTAFTLDDPLNISPMSEKCIFGILNQLLLLLFFHAL